MSVLSMKSMIREHWQPLGEKHIIIRNVVFFQTQTTEEIEEARKKEKKVKFSLISNIILNVNGSKKEKKTDDCWDENSFILYVKEEQLRLH